MTMSCTVTQRSRIGEFGAGLLCLFRSSIRNAALAAFTIAATASAASAETLLMPDRDMLASTSEVVWGITTLPNGTNYSIDFGDASSSTGTVADRSYIAFNHTYPSSGSYTVTLTVGAEVATGTVHVYNGALLTADVLRDVNVSRAIQSGLRYLWYNQGNRTTFDTNIETYWSAGGVSGAFTALAVQAFQNQGFQLPNSNVAPTGIYAKYAVRRGLNYLLKRLTSETVGITTQGVNACAGSLPAGTECSALYMSIYGYSGYENGLAMLAFAGTGALNRTVAEVTTANVTGQTLGQVLQRLVNASIYGQAQSGAARGGWYYNLNQNGADGSVAGWELIGLLDAEAAGMTVPAAVKTQWSNALANALNTDGSFDYQADGNPASPYYPNIAKTGVGIQGMFFAGRPSSDTDLAHAKVWMANDWNNHSLSQYNCGNGTDNKGCGYGMFQTFKGLKLYGVATLPGIGYTPPAGTTSIAADDWYADYVDYLVSTQTSPTSTSNGSWSGMYFSGAYSYDINAGTAIALLILSPTALVLPDPTQFATLGLQQGNPLSTNALTNPVTNPPGTHTVTGITVASNGAPVPSVTVTFKIVSGPNFPQQGSGVTGTNGQVTWTYTDTGGAGQDKIQAFVGALASNQLIKNWVVPVAVCDMNNDGKIDITDIKKIQSLVNTTPSSPNWDARADSDFNGIVNSNDARVCALRCTKPACAQ
jgi:hypothetical protein